jgi:hypothetical protein
VAISLACQFNLIPESSPLRALALGMKFGKPATWMKFVRMLEACDRPRWSPSYYRKLWIDDGMKKAAYPSAEQREPPVGVGLEGDATDAVGSREAGCKRSQ